MLSQIGGADPCEILSPLVVLSHFLYDRNQPFNGVSHFIGWTKPHFLLDFDLQTFSNSTEHVLFGRGLALDDFDLVDVLHVLEVADV